MQRNKVVNLIVYSLPYLESRAVFSPKGPIFLELDIFELFFFQGRAELGFWVWLLIWRH